MGKLYKSIKLTKMKTENKITQTDVILHTITTKYKGVGISKTYRHMFDINGTTYEKTTDGVILFHSHETHQGVILDVNYATKKEFAKIVVEHFNNRIK